ncbi:hypothetical protein [Streptomyces sp. NBC_01353]|uniref:hypothetical protein n=1 Tax=Streptomyces sp. NBC_01353 TaxID=2903835 RepID=UPI002E36808C|nr:hypothetical protein [Streptomyces sp. NBC_01353]
MPEPSLADKPRQVHIVSEGHTARVQVDGTDLSRSLRGYTLEHRIDQPPLLVLYAAATRGPLEFEGLAHVVVGEEQQNPAETIADFLRSLDPQTLEQAALNRDDLGQDRYALARAMLQQAADWAQGKGN